MVTDTTIYVLRQTTLKGDTRWVVFDTQRIMHGGAKEPQAYLLNRWVRKYGRPVKVIAFAGIMRPSEAAMTIAYVNKAEVV